MRLTKNAVTAGAGGGGGWAGGLMHLSTTGDIWGFFCTSTLQVKRSGNKIISSLPRERFMKHKLCYGEGALVSILQGLLGSTRMSWYSLSAREGFAFTE